MDTPIPSFKDLPTDVLIEVFYHLSATSLTATAMASQCLASLAKTSIVWKRLCQTTYGITFKDSRESCDLLCASWKEVFQNLFTKPHIANLSTSSTTYTGCNHYNRKCQIRARCCNDFYPCRLCHDSVCDHSIDRFATDTMICMKCLCVQAANKFCTSCNGEMASYYCQHCKLWASDKGPIYHCDKCGICRQGKGLGIDNWHCDNCGICLSLSVKATHECQIKNGLKEKCMLCASSQLLFYSRETVTVLPCGHAAHLQCIEHQVQNNPQIGTGLEALCPLCPKTKPTAQQTGNDSQPETGRVQRNPQPQQTQEIKEEKTETTRTQIPQPQQTPTPPTHYAAYPHYSTPSYIPDSYRGFDSVAAGIAFRPTEYGADFRNWGSSSATGTTHLSTDPPDYLGLKGASPSKAAQGVGLWSQHHW